MLILFLDSTGVVHQEFVPPGETVNAQFYPGVSDRLRKRITRVRPETWENLRFFLLRNEASAHTATTEQQFLAKKGVTVLSHTITPQYEFPDYF